MSISSGSKILASDITAHINNKNNPHGITATSIGAVSTQELTASYMVFCTNANADSLDAAFGKNNSDKILGIGNQLAMYSWFKGDSKTNNPYTISSNIETLSELYSNENAIFEIKQTGIIPALIDISPFAKEIRASGLDNESIVCRVIAKRIGLSSWSSYTTVLSLTNNSTFMGSSTFIDLAFSYPSFVKFFCANNTNWQRMSNYTVCMKSFQSSSVVKNYLDNSTGVLSSLSRANGTTVSNALTGNVVYIHNCSSVNEGNYGNNRFSLGKDLDGVTYTQSGYNGLSGSISRKFFKPSTCSKSGDGPVTLTYKKIS